MLCLYGFSPAFLEWDSVGVVDLQKVIPDSGVALTPSPFSLSLSSPPPYISLIPTPECSLLPKPREMLMTWARCYKTKLKKNPRCREHSPNTVSTHSFSSSSSFSSQSLLFTVTFSSSLPSSSFFVLRHVPFFCFLKRSVRNEPPSVVHSVLSFLPPGFKLPSHRQPKISAVLNSADLTFSHNVCFLPFSVTETPANRASGSVRSLNARLIQFVCLLDPPAPAGNQISFGLFSQRWFLIVKCGCGQAVLKKTSASVLQTQEQC